MNPKKPLSTAYAKRIESGLRRGLTKTQAIGKPLRSELSATSVQIAKIFETRITENPRSNSLLTQILRLNSDTLIKQANRALKATGGTIDPINPLVERLAFDVHTLLTSGASVKGSGNMRGLTPDYVLTETVHIVVDKINTELAGSIRFKTFTSDGRFRLRDASFDEAIADAIAYDFDYDRESDVYYDGPY